MGLGTARESSGRSENATWDLDAVTAIGLELTGFLAESSIDESICKAEIMNSLFKAVRFHVKQYYTMEFDRNWMQNKIHLLETRLENSFSFGQGFSFEVELYFWRYFAGSEQVRIRLPGGTWGQDTVQ